MADDTDQHDDFEPDALPQKIREAYGDKIALETPQILALGFLAGAFIAFGSLAFLIAQAVPDAAPFGVTQLVSGLAFSAGLILVMIAGAELFTGNTLMLSRLYAGETPAGPILRAWSLAWLGNLAGSLFVVALFLAAGGHEAGDGLVGQAAIETAGAKTAKGPLATLASGVLANMLVCLAVWMTFAARTVPGKIMAIVPPITVFVAAGFEHSVANMSLIPAGLGVLALEGAGQATDLPDMAGLVANLLWSTLGNILGGAIIAGGYHLGYPKK